MPRDENKRKTESGPEMGIDRQLLGKAFTDIGFFRGLWDLVLQPSWDWEEPDLGEAGYEFPDDETPPQFEDGDAWGPWLYEFDLFLVRELNLRPANMDPSQKDEFLAMRRQIVNLARRPQEHRQEVKSSWSEFTALTNTLSQGGGGVC